MNLKTITALVLFASLLSILFLNTRRIEEKLSMQLSTPDSIASPNLNCTPTFVDGGGPYYKPDSPFRQYLAPTENVGQKLIVTGKVLKNDCQTPFPGTTLDIWQANESGSYQDEWYRGRVRVLADGNYIFETVIPLGYGEGTTYRPPHIHFKVFEGAREVITSQMFLPAAREQQIEGTFIVKVEEKEEGGKKVYYATHDIVVPE